MIIPDSTTLSEGSGIDGSGIEEGSGLEGSGIEGSGEGSGEGAIVTSTVSLERSNK